jgi:ABC-2 type transport system permease protein
MTTIPSAPRDAAIRARRAGFVHDAASVARRALLLTRRDLNWVGPSLIVPLFLFAVNVGSLQKVAEAVQPGFDFRAFQLPVAIVFAVTGISRASTLVVDIQQGYFNRLLVTPMNRMALLIGLMVADLVLVIALSIPVTLMGFAVGIRFAAGPLGVLAFLLLATLWGLVFTGFPYAIAMKSGSIQAVNSTFILFLPFAFLTTTFVPKEAMTDWMATITTYNPMTYLLAALRSLITDGWDPAVLGRGVAAVLGVGLVSHGLAFLTLRGRLDRG